MLTFLLILGCIALFPAALAGAATLLFAAFFMVCAAVEFARRQPIPALVLFLCAVSLAILFGCATASIHSSPKSGTTIHLGAFGEGSLATICIGKGTVGGGVISGDGKTVTVDQVKADLAEVEGMTPELLAELRFSQLPSSNGVCITARGAGISKEVEKLVYAYIMAQGLGVVSGAVDIGADAVAQ
jgi:hypothetical protein